ncbi:MAG TPA: RluA family pseudouridine synthase [Candidatus Moranbacteria bacterium]|nr:RluA family pseudouridine synthase [Candidatus Moranbacteria bacterium]
MRKIVVQDSAGKRIDQFLAHKYPKLTRNFVQKKIAAGKVLLNNQPVSRSYKLRKNDEIRLIENFFSLSQSTKIKLLPNPNIPFKVIFQNKHFAIIEKMAGLAIHPDNRPNVSPRQNTLVNGLIAYFPTIKVLGDDPLRPGIVHRLDKETSGLLIIALSQQAFNFFKRKFKERKIEKTYLACVWGHPKKNNATIQTPIGKSKSDLTKQSTSKHSSKLINPKKAITHWRVLKKMTDRSLLEVKIETGRKHQIRVHLHSIGHPIVGDKKYQTKTTKALNQDLSRQLLHAHKLKFQYLDGEKYEFESATPKEFKLN